MKIGAMIFATDQTLKMTRLAPELEARGFDTLWVPEKTHLPASRTTPWPGGELPEWYKRTGDPFVTLAAAAAVTTTLRVGTGVAMVPIRDAVITAKEVATLDWLSDGRFEFGIGYGWNAEEFATHGVDIANASAIMKDKMALMERLWQNDIGNYEGDHARVAPSWSWPKPYQLPRPPVHLGSRASTRNFDDIAACADGWIPIEGYGDIIGQLPKLRAAFDRAGRTGDTPLVSVYSSAGDPDMVAQYADAGIDRTIITLPPVAEEDVLRSLDGHTKKLARFL